MKPPLNKLLQEFCEQHRTTVGTLRCSRSSPQQLRLRIEFTHAARRAKYGYLQIAKELRTSVSTVHRYGKYYNIDNNQIIKQ